MKKKNTSEQPPFDSGEDDNLPTKSTVMKNGKNKPKVKPQSAERKIADGNRKRKLKPVRREKYRNYLDEEE